MAYVVSVQMWPVISQTKATKKKFSSPTLIQTPRSDYCQKKSGLPIVGTITLPFHGPSYITDLEAYFLNPTLLYRL